MFTLQVDDEIDLGLLQERHAQMLFDLTDRNREHLRKWLIWVDSTKTAEDSKEYIKSTLQRLAENDGFQVGIFYKGELAGMIGYLYWNWTTRRTEIGYWLGRDFNGKGIMTRSVRKLTEYAFGELGLNRVEIRCAPGNLKSRAIPERLGFTQEGILRKVGLIQDQIIDDLVVYGLLADEWKAKNVQPES